MVPIVNIWLYTGFNSDTYSMVSLDMYNTEPNSLSIVEFDLHPVPSYMDLNSDDELTILSDDWHSDEESLSAIVTVLYTWPIP